MQSAQPKVRIAILLFVPLYLFYGFLASAWGYVTLRDWSAYRPAFLACSTLWIILGPVMFISAIAFATSLGRHSRWLRIGAISAILCGTIMVVSALTGVMPCSGPD